MLNECFDPRLNPSQPPIGFWMQQEQEAALSGWDPIEWRKGNSRIWHDECSEVFFPFVRVRGTLIIEKLNACKTLEDAMMACWNHERKV